MDKKEYLQEAVGKIVDDSAKNAVIAELESHIDDKTDLFKSIDYPDEISEEKAVQSMGSAELVRDSFAEIHNEFYNPCYDILTLVIHTVLLGGVYFLIRSYVSGDAGLLSTLLLSAFVGASLMLSDVALSLKHKRIITSVFSLVKLAVNCVFNYLVFSEIDKACNSDIGIILKSFITPQLLRASNYYSKSNVAAFVCIAGIIGLIGIVCSLNYSIKTKLTVNKLIDNRICRSARGTYRYFFFVALAICVLFAVKQYYDYNFFKNQYFTAYETVLDISEKCASAQDVDEYIDKTEGFDEVLDVDGNRTGYQYKKGYAVVDINYDFEELPEPENLDEAAILSMQNDEIGYKYTVTFSADEKYFDKGFDSFTLGWLRVTDDRILDFHGADLSSMPAEEQYKHFKQYTPVVLNLVQCDRTLYNKSYDFTYIFSKGKYKYEQYSSVKLSTDICDEYKTNLKRIISAVNSNPDATIDALAALTGYSPEEKTLDLSAFFNEYNNVTQYFGPVTYYEYDMGDGIHFQLDDKTPRRYMATYTESELIELIPFNIYDTNGNRINGRYTEQDNEGKDVFKKTSVKGYYYDREGRCYNNVRYVTYYTRDNEKYYFYSTVTKTESTDEYDIKNFYLTDRKSNVYDASQCYVDVDGYLVFDTAGSFKKGDGEYYVSPSGKDYTRALFTSWDENGSIVPFNSGE